MIKSGIKLGKTLIYKWSERNLSHKFLGLSQNLSLAHFMREKKERVKFEFEKRQGLKVAALFVQKGHHNGESNGGRGGNFNLPDNSVQLFIIF